MKCVICGQKWDDTGLISGKVDLTTTDTPRNFSFENQPICAKCIAGMSQAMAENAKEAVDAIEEEKKKKRIKGAWE